MAQAMKNKHWLLSLLVLTMTACGVDEGVDTSPSPCSLDSKASTCAPFSPDMIVHDSNEVLSGTFETAMGRVEMRYTVVNGVAVTEGDIVLGPADKTGRHTKGV